MVTVNGLLKLVQLTYDVLKDAVKVAHNGIVHHGWSSNYVKNLTCSWNQPWGITRNFGKCQELQGNNLPNDNPQCTALTIKQHTNPELFTMWKFPLLYFLGAVKSSVQSFMTFLYGGVSRRFSEAILTHFWKLCNTATLLAQRIPCQTGKFGYWPHWPFLKTIWVKHELLLGFVATWTSWPHTFLIYLCQICNHRKVGLRRKIITGQWYEDKILGEVQCNWMAWCEGIWWVLLKVFLQLHLQLEEKYQWLNSYCAASNGK